MTSDVMDEFNKWIEENPWFYPVVIGVLVILFLVLDIFRRKKKIEEIQEDSINDSDFFRNLRARDITFLICNFIFMALPMIAVIILYTISEKNPEKDLENTYMYILLYCFVASVALAYLRKDFLLFILWKIPTLTLGQIAHETVDDPNTYDIEIDSNGHGRISEHNSGFSWLMFLLGLFLFAFKFCIMIIYLLCSTLANFILSIIVYPIMYSIYIYKDTKYIKQAEQY